MQVDYVKLHLQSVCLLSIYGAKVGDGVVAAVAGPPSAPLRRAFHWKLENGEGAWYKIKNISHQFSLFCRC